MNLRLYRESRHLLLLLLEGPCPSRHALLVRFDLVPHVGHVVSVVLAVLVGRERFAGLFVAQLKAQLEPIEGSGGGPVGLAGSPHLLPIHAQSSPGVQIPSETHQHPLRGVVHQLDVLFNSPGGFCGQRERGQEGGVEGERDDAAVG